MYRQQSAMHLGCSPIRRAVPPALLVPGTCYAGVGWHPLPAPQINCYLHVNGQNRLRQRTYTVHNHVRYGYRFQNIVKHPAESRWMPYAVGHSCGSDARCMGQRDVDACPLDHAPGAKRAHRALALSPLKNTLDRTPIATPRPTPSRPATHHLPPHMHLLPQRCRDRKPRVRWAHFHDIAPLSEEELGAMPPRTAVGLQPVPSQPNLPALYESETGRIVVQKTMCCRDARLWHAAHVCGLAGSCSACLRSKLACLSVPGIPAAYNKACRHLEALPVRTRLAHTFLPMAPPCLQSCRRWRQSRTAPCARRSSAYSGRTAALQQPRWAEVTGGTAALLHLPPTPSGGHQGGRRAPCQAWQQRQQLAALAVGACRHPPCAANVPPPHSRPAQSPRPQIDPASTVSGSLGDVPVRRRPNGQQLGLPPLPGRPPSQPGSGRLAPAYVPSAEEQRNDHTVLPIDLSR